MKRMTVGLRGSLFVLAVLFVLPMTGWTQPLTSPLEKYRKLEFPPKDQNFAKGWQDRVALEYEIINAADLKSLRIALKDEDPFVRAIAARALGILGDKDSADALAELKKDEVEKLGAAVYVVLAMDLHRTRVFKEENLLLSKGKGPFSKEKSLVYATALSDPAGYASALYGVARKCPRWGAWVENQPHWFVIDRKGTLSYMLEPKFDTPTAYEKDVEQVLEELKKAAR